MTDLNEFDRVLILLAVLWIACGWLPNVPALAAGGVLLATPLIAGWFILRHVRGER